MDLETAIYEIGKEWDKPAGCFGRLREGDFEEAGVERVAELLRAVGFNDNSLLEVRFVHWFGGFRGS